MAMTMISTQDLTRDFGSKRAIDHLDIEIPEGRLVALLGPNGAGKSTLLKLLTGQLEPTIGKAFVLDTDARALPSNIIERLSVLHEGHEPPNWATGKDLMLLESDASPKFDDDLARRLCFSSSVSPKKRYGTLSKGQKRILTAGIVLASGADLMLFDEPADGLDTSVRRKLYDEIRDIVTERDATAIVATHIIYDIERVADDVAIISNGGLLIYASLEDLREQIREVELAADAEIPETDEIEILSSRNVRDTKLLCLRCKNGETDLERIFGSYAIINKLGLEDVYLAFTERATESESDMGDITCN